MTDLNLGSAALITSMWQFKAEKIAPDRASTGHVMMYAGRDDIHGSLVAALGAVRRSLVMNMYGMDDPALWDIVWGLIENPAMLVKITLDKSQAGGPTERKILDATRGRDLVDFNSHVVVGQSMTHQISHTKGGVIDGVLGFHGSVNWSASGEGTFVQETGPGGVGYKAQNNTLSWFTDQPSVNGFRDELDLEHASAMAQFAKTTSTKAAAPAPEPTQG